MVAEVLIVCKHYDLTNSVGKKDKNHDLLNRPALLLITAANYHVGTLSVILTPIVSFLLPIDSIFHADETEYQHDRVSDL